MPRMAYYGNAGGISARLNSKAYPELQNPKLTTLYTLNPES